MPPSAIPLLALLIVLTLCGVALFIVGLRLTVSVFRPLPKATAVRNTFLGVLFATWGVALMAVFIYFDQPILGLLFFGSGFLIAGANALREYIVRSLREGKK